MLELYYYENSVRAERVLMTLQEKGIGDWVPHRLLQFEGEHFRADYLKLNPTGVVPTLVHDGKVSRESAVICDYLDDLSADPADRARTREWGRIKPHSIGRAVSSFQKRREAPS